MLQVFVAATYAQSVRAQSNMTTNRHKRIILISGTTILLLAVLIVSYLGHRNNEVARERMKFEAYSKPVPIGGWSSIKDSIKYPELFYRAGLEGDAYVMVVIDSNGVTKYVRVEPSYPFADTIRSTLQGVKWYPGRRKGKNVIDSADLSIHFVAKVMGDRAFIVQPPFER